MNVVEKDMKQVEQQGVFQQDTKKNFWLGMKQILPVAAAGVIDGMVFGILATQAGFSITQTVLFSLLVNAASSQFAALGLISQGIVGWPVLLSTALLNARHLLYGLSLGPYFRNLPTWKAGVMGLMLNDETYALKMTQLRTGGKPNFPFFLGAGLIDYLIWIVSTLAGAIFGTVITNPEAYGLDFAFIATFLGFLAMNLSSRFYVKAAILAGAASCAGYYLQGVTLAVILGTLSAVLMGVFADE